MYPRCPDDDRFGLFTPESRVNPYPVFARMRAEEPVHASAAAGGWIVTRYADVAAGARDLRLSSRRGRAYGARLPETLRSRLSRVLGNIELWLAMIDPPEHTRLRALVNKSLTPRVIDGLRPRIEAIVDDLLARSESAAFEVVGALAYPLPVIVIAELLGMPREDRGRFKRWSDALAAFMGVSAPTEAVIDEAVRSMDEFESYLCDEIRRRRAAPRDDLLGLLLRAEDEGRALREPELLSMCVNLLFAGHETTTNLIGNAVYLFAHHPDQLALLRSDPTLLPSAIEEVLRFESPVARIGRIATEDLLLRGERIRQGDRVFLSLAAANRDPDCFPHPERFDVRRTDNRHLSFGLGAHFCVGAALARSEAQVALRKLLERFSSLRLAGAPVWINNLTIRGLSSLTLTR